MLGSQCPHRLHEHIRTPCPPQRDTYATRMLNNGMRLEKVSHLLGHATVTQTQKYAKFAKRDVADRAREIMNGS
ncbi:tyrosine-type recombinase/integrase [Leisingera sp. ANG-S5]|uniref:tyrosine-type recombinase/integrase n=1 Tax=Leisingera sp. ANG-S5 TaxID=1577901 RepID=UPI00406CA4AD